MNYIQDRLLEVDREEVVENRLRRYYRLTPAGAERLGCRRDAIAAHAGLAAAQELHHPSLTSRDEDDRSFTEAVTRRA